MTGGVCLLALILATAAPAAARASQLAGSVLDAAGAPLAGVTITVRGTIDRTVQTDSDGRFEFAEIPEGEYDLVAVLPGFAPGRRQVRLQRGETVRVALTLSVASAEYTLVTAARSGAADVQTVPMAISVRSGAELERAEAHTLAQIAGTVPSVTFSQNTGFAQLTIRGIGTNTVFAGSDPSSTVYLDGVYLARPAMMLADFLGLERVEVVRGPQGTLYGRNAVGGAVNVITRPPTNDLEVSARVVAGSSRTLRSEGRVSGPLVRGRILGSAVFLRGVRDGFVTDLEHPGNRLGGEDVTAARGQVRLVLNPRSELLVSADATHQDPAPLTWAKVLMVKPGFVVDNPADLHEVRASTPAEGRNLQYGAAARFTLDLTRATRLTSLSAFRTLDYDRLVDTDITELELNATRIHEMQHQLSEEMTIAGRTPRLAWVGGLFLFSELDRQPTSIRMAGAQRENLLDPRVDAASRALFGQTTLTVAGPLALTAGLRYTRERKVIDNAGLIRTLDTAATTVSGSSYAYTDQITDNAWTPKVQVSLQANENTLAYLSATRGFKSGGFNLTSTEVGRGYAPEWAWSYEAGLKATRGRTRLNLAAFYNDYTDLQVQTGIRPGVIDVSNAAAATIRGVEAEGHTRVAPTLQAGGHVAWLDATYARYIAVGTGGLTGDVAGHRLNNAPEWSGRVWLEWNPNAGGSRALSFRADTTWQTTVFFNPFNDTIQRQSPYALVDLSAEFSPVRCCWSVSAFARNLTGRDYITGSFGTPQPAIGGRPGETRQAGLRFNIRR